MFFKFILFLFVVGVLLRFVMRYVMPVVQVSKMAHREMNNMRKRMEDMQQQQGPQPQQKKATQDRHIDGEYIDYEEVK